MIGSPEGHADYIETMEGGLAVLTDCEKRGARTVTESGKEILTVCRDANFRREMMYLKDKIDADAGWILTQFFLDPQVFLDLVHECRACGIMVPIVPGIMCLDGFRCLDSLTQWCKARLPEGLLERAEKANLSAKAFREFAIGEGVAMCKALDDVALGLHFYILHPKPRGSRGWQPATSWND